MADWGDGREDLRGFKKLIYIGMIGRGGVLLE